MYMYLGNERGWNTHVWALPVCGCLHTRARSLVLGVTFSPADSVLLLQPSQVLWPGAATTHDLQALWRTGAPGAACTCMVECQGLPAFMRMHTGTGVRKAPSHCCFLHIPDRAYESDF